MGVIVAVAILLILIFITIIIFTIPIPWTQNVYFKYSYRLWDLMDLYRHPKQSDDINKENLLLFNQVANNCGLEFWASEGTALGLIREGSLISGDSDVDVGIYETEIQTLQKVVHILIKYHGFKVMRNNPLSITRNHQYIDIDITSDQKSCMAIQWPRPCTDHMPYIQPFQYIQYENCTFTVPSMQYIEKLYGKKWYIPKKGFKPHHLNVSKLCG